MYIKYKHLIFSLCAAAMFTACSDQDEAEFDSKPNEIVFVSGLNNYVTRVSQDGSKWTTGDRVGIYMVNTGTTTTAQDYTNLPYKAQSEAQTTTFKADGTTMFYPEEGAVDFIAYYPYSATIADMIYPVDLADQLASLVAHDLLYATSNNSGNGFTDGSISLAFKHQLSKITLNLVDEKGNVVTPDADGITIKGMNTTARFDLKTGKLENETTAVNIIPYKNGDSFEVVLLPFTIASGHEVTLIVNGNEYLWTMSNSFDQMEIKKGFSYIFKITVKTSATEVEADLVDYEGNSISPWGDGGDDNKEVEPTDDLEIPVDFEQIELASGESIKSALTGAGSDKVAIILADGASYSESEGFNIPNTITSLIIVGEGGITPPSVYMGKEMKATGDMDLLHFYNINLHGTSGGYIINQNIAVTIGEIFFEKSSVHDVRGVLRIQAAASTINSFKVTNSLVYNIGNYNLIALGFNGSLVSSVEITKSTLCNFESRCIHMDGLPTAASTVVIDQCTFDLGPYYAIVQLNGTTKGTLDFTNNIIGLPYPHSDPEKQRGVSVLSNGTMTMQSNNYYVSDTSWQSSAVGTDCGFNAAELFADPDNGNYTQSKLNAGDPRWQK